MFSSDDTIAAIATPLGRSGVGIVRLSGPASARIVSELMGRSRPLRARHATFGRLGSPSCDRSITWPTVAQLAR